VSAPPAEEAWSLGLARLAALLGRDLQRAARALGGPAALWGAPADALAAALRLDAASARAVADLRAGFDAAAARAELHAAGLGQVDAADAAFPDRLRAIFDPPFGLFTRGDAGPALARLAAGPAVAVVGSRRATPAGRRLAHELAAALAARGATVVSGLAQGIDAAAHAGALEAGGLTVAVLGAGLDVPYPRRNQALARTIAARGLLLSEYWPGTPPAPWRFPARNRVVAGLADAVAVVEAGRRSGALITADFALEEGREVFAVPGEITSALSAGTNALLKLGAAPLTSADDVLDVLGIERAAAAADPDVSETAERLLSLVRDGPVGPDELSVRASLEAGAVSVALTELELAGLVTAGDGVYRAVR
jgi:DNA processing protein